MSVAHKWGTPELRKNYARPIHGPARRKQDSPTLLFEYGNLSIEKTWVT